MYVCTNLNMNIFTLYICTYIFYFIFSSIKYVWVYSTPSWNWICKVSVIVVYEWVYVIGFTTYVLAAKVCCQTVVYREGEAGLSQNYSERFCLQHCFGIHSTILGKFANQLRTVTVRLVISSCFSVCPQLTTRFPSGRIFLTFSYWGLLIKYVDGFQLWLQKITCFTWRHT